ncbi:helicase-related protein [Cellulomonas humilata]|uniref:RNA polymerase primary sigma factor n=1 Tax=Cellulomonas humilata TaxID=144055 RepID=A0ABU0EBF8_9CELL|nr:helicase-related protein [Cellulomonas humilata]MDQ0372428.1 RNA polymerase primary sigma factor [Cellulomonas humilata]
MSTPSDVLHAALCARPLQTASELTLSVADAGQDALTTAEIEQLLLGDPRLRPDSSTPPRWRALGAGHAATLLNLPTPRRQVPQVIAPAASFGDRAGPAVGALPDGRGGILPAAAFAGRPSARMREDAPTPPMPVRVPVSARLTAVPKPVEAPVQRTFVPTFMPTAEPAFVPTFAPAAEPAFIPTAEPTVDATVGPAVAPAVNANSVPTVETTSAPTVEATFLPTAEPTVEATFAPTAEPTVEATFAPIVEPTVTPERVPTTAPAPVTNPTTRVAEPLPVRVEPEDRAAAAPFATAPATPAGGPFRALAAPPAVDRGPLPPGGEVRYVGPQLRRWQKDVLDAWLAEDRRGIVEAVSAQGRGIVGVLAAWDALTRGEKVLVLVPTSDLLEQWFSTLELHLPGLSIGRRDITTAYTFDECDVLVSLVSAAFGHQLLEDGRAGLVIADEVHKYGSARPAATLRAEFGARLGLTSSMERQDPGADEVLRPYFGAVLDGCDLRRGRKDGALAPFRLAFVAVDLDAQERAEYDALSAQISELTDRLSGHGCTPDRFVEDVIRLQGGLRENARAAADASAYLRAVSTRRDLLATSSAKTGALATLAPTLARSTHALVFTHTKDGADAAAAGLRAAGVSAAWLHNGLEPEIRRNTLRDLRSGRLTVVTAPKVLDEGLDLPTVDAVVMLAASRSYRQLVQRVGAVLHLTEADRLPVVLVVHARGTVDTDDGLVADLAAVATEVRSFDVGTSGAAIAAWFLGA